MARALRLLAVAALLVGLGTLAGFAAALLRPRRTVAGPNHPPASDELDGMDALAG